MSIYDVNGNTLFSEDKQFSRALDANEILTISSATSMLSTFSDVYDAYDSLLENVDHEKNLLGYGTNSSGSQDTNLPIYEYVLFNPLEPNYPDHPTFAIRSSPKICLTSGIHGNERTAVVGLYNCIKAIVNDSSEAAKTLRNSAQYRIVPVINPGGYNDNTRNNRHNVNLNRNFKPYWNTQNASGKGTAPYSEYESQALRDWCAEQASTTLFMVDFHNKLPANTETYFYIFTDVPVWKDAWAVVCRGMYDHFLAESIDLGDYPKFQEGNLVAGIASEFLIEHGVPSGGIESPNNPNSPTDNQWVKPTAEIHGTFINYMLHSYLF